ncbi:MAG: hypothetical protein FJZ90_19430 [Chloroflexi bacterium]|nr:hypothetical protein [Chloroflexota bacterium]
MEETEDGAMVEKDVRASYDEAFRREWQHFDHCVTERREPITSGEQGRADVALLLDIIKAVRV